MTATPPERDLLDVGVLGSVNRDTIERPGTAPRQQLGGILFTACALAHLGRGRLRVWPLARLSTDLAPCLPARIGAPPDLRFDTFIPLDDTGYRCHIRYGTAGDKTEILLGDVVPLGYEEVSPWLGRLGALVVNFITGFEIELSTLRRLRAELDGPLLVDVHSLTLARGPDGRRLARRPPDWQAWVAQADVVQMNAAEARILAGLDPGDGGALREFARVLLDLGPQVALITRGDAGAVGAWRKAGRVEVVTQEAEPGGSDFDPTGCGDVFLAAFASTWLLDREPRPAIAAAVHAASLKGRLDGLNQLHRLAHRAAAHGGTHRPCHSSSISRSHPPFRV